MNLGAVFFVGNLTCSFHMLHSWPTQFYVGPPTSTFLATLVTHSLSLLKAFKIALSNITYIILSVNFEPLCIGPIISISAVKGDRKGEIEQSPKKKKFKDSTISREDIDDAIANGIKLAFKEQQSTLDLVLTSAVRDAVDSVLIPALRELRADIQATNNSVKELRMELEVSSSVY